MKHRGHLFVEEVDSECTLQGVVVHVPEFPGPEVAVGHLGKPGVLLPVETSVGVVGLPPATAMGGEDGGENVNAVAMELGVEEDVEEEKLSDGVDEVEELDTDLQKSEVVEGSSAETAEAGAGEKVLEAEGDLIPARPVQHQVVPYSMRQVPM